MPLYNRPVIELTTVPGLERLLVGELGDYHVNYRPLSGRVYLDSAGHNIDVRRLRLVENARLLLGESGDLGELLADVMPLFIEYGRGLRLFAVHAERVTKDIDATSVDIARTVGKVIEEETGMRVSLDAPDIVFYVEYEGGRYRAGVDITPYRGLRDRPYRVFVHRTALNPVIAAAMCMLAGDAETIYDPFCGSGTIPLECASQGRRLALGSDVTARFVRGAVLNARLSRMYGQTHFFSADALLTPLAGDIDAIVSNPPFGLRERALGGLRRIYRSIFRTAARLNAPRIVLLTPRGRLLASASRGSSYVLAQRLPIIEGGLRSSIYIFLRS